MDVMEIQTKELLARLDERTGGIKDNIESILDQLTKLNSKVATHEKEIHSVKIELATSKGHWAGVNRTILVIISLLSIAVGAIATYKWH